MAIRLLMTLVCMLLLTTAVQAELYRWVDGNGTINFTEDLQSIPAKYRKSARSSDDFPATERAPAAPAGEKGVEPTVKGDLKDGTSVRLYDGKRGEVWRDELRQARAELKAYQEHLEMKRKLLSDTSRMGRREYVGLQSDVKELEVKVGDLKGRLDRLEKAAASAGVPSSFR